jgi:hypothetical protein
MNVYGSTELHGSSGATDCTRVVAITSTPTQTNKQTHCKEHYPFAQARKEWSMSDVEDGSGSGDEVGGGGGGWWRVLVVVVVVVVVVAVVLLPGASDTAVVAAFTTADEHDAQCSDRSSTMD